MPLIDLCCLVQIIVFDIKAGNVLLDQDGVTAKITDVGLSKMLAGSNTATLLVCADTLSCVRLMPQNISWPITISLLLYSYHLIPPPDVYQWACSHEQIGQQMPPHQLADR